MLFIMIIENSRFRKKCPKSSVFSAPDLLLMTLHRLKFASDFKILSAIFGCSESAVSDNFCKMITFLVDFFKGTIKPIENIDFEDEVRKLDAMGAPNPKAIFTGVDYYFFCISIYVFTADCQDIPIEINSSYYTTHKKNIKGESP